MVPVAALQIDKIRETVASLQVANLDELNLAFKYADTLQRDNCIQDTEFGMGEE